ncbi:MAG: hypothetical protein ABIH23_24435, partial [bacterium]
MEPLTEQTPVASDRTHSRLSVKVAVAKWVIIAFACLLLTVPYVAGYLFSSDDYRFQGAVDYVEDVQSYFMWMRSAADHPGLPPNLYLTTSEPPGFFHLLWVGIGKLSRVTGVPITVLYHLSHVISVLLFLLALWRFIGRFFADNLQTCVAYGVCVLGSGFGWYTLTYDRALPAILRNKVLITDLSLDLWSADVNTFYSLLVSPHFALALWLLIEALDRLYGAITTGDKRARLSGAIFTFVLGFVHVYDMFIVAAVALVFWAV